MNNCKQDFFCPQMPKRPEKLVTSLIPILNSEIYSIVKSTFGEAVEEETEEATEPTETVSTAAL